MLEIMKCNLCGKQAIIIRDGGKRTICCDQLMEKLVEQGAEQGAASSHVPVIEKTKEGIKVKVPGVAGPMKADHYIEWIDVMQGNSLQVKGLKPGDAPEAEFDVTGEKVKVRVYCEKHGLWSNKPSKPHN
jgi:superoxide reductase